VIVARRKNENDRDADYLERTAVRLRHMASTIPVALEGDADDVRSRLRHIAYGGSRKRNLQNGDSG
jgi:hypothetical protein